MKGSGLLKIHGCVWPGRLRQKITWGASVPGPDSWMRRDCRPLAMPVTEGIAVAGPGGLWLGVQVAVMCCRIGAPSRPGEFHPEPLTEPCVNLSIYTARAIHEGLLSSATTIRLLLLPVDQNNHDANGLPPSLHGNYPASSLLRSSPSLIDALVLSA